MFNQKVYELHIKINTVLYLLVYIYLLYFENQHACNKYLTEVQLTFHLL